MNLPAALAALVRERAGGRCEYCRMAQSLQGGTFHLEHVIPQSRGGSSTAENVPLACPGCNLHKADRVSAIDPETGNEAPLFHPRTNRWSAHFGWDGERIVGKTATGRATLTILQFNHPRRLHIRVAEAGFGLFPPD
jgi:hypothetical protein